MEEESQCADGRVIVGYLFRSGDVRKVDDEMVRFVWSLLSFSSVEVARLGQRGIQLRVSRDEIPDQSPVFLEALYLHLPWRELRLAAMTDVKGGFMAVIQDVSSEEMTGCQIRISDQVQHHLVEVRGREGTRVGQYW